MSDGLNIAVEAERNRLRRLIWEHRVIVVVTLIVFLIVWEIAGRLTNPLFFAPPSAVATAFWDALFDPEARLLRALLETLSILVPGFVLACVVGVALGVGVLVGAGQAGVVACHALQPDDVAADVGDVQAEAHLRVGGDVGQLRLVGPAVDEDGAVLAGQEPDRDADRLAVRADGGQPDHEVAAQTAQDALAVGLGEVVQEFHGSVL